MDNNKQTSLPKILTVEDDLPTRQVFIKTFTKNGFQVLEAKDGIEGLEIAFKEHPDLILLDILMPKMDGLTMLEKLHADDWGKKVPIIVLTNSSEADMIKKTKEYGIYAYIVKTDWLIDDVVSLVKGKLGIK